MNKTLYNYLMEVDGTEYGYNVSPRTGEIVLASYSYGYNPEDIIFSKYWIVRQILKPFKRFWLKLENVKSIAVPDFCLGLISYISKLDDTDDLKQCIDDYYDQCRKSDNEDIVKYISKVGHYYHWNVFDNIESQGFAHVMSLNSQRVKKSYWLRKDPDGNFALAIVRYYVVNIDELKLLSMDTFIMPKDFIDYLEEEFTGEDYD